MNIMSRYALRLVGIGAFAIAFPQFGSASDSENRATMAMGPTSAARRRTRPADNIRDDSADPEAARQGQPQNMHS
jgi:hypothetical protein